MALTTNSFSQISQVFALSHIDETSYGIYEVNTSRFQQLFSLLKKIYGFETSEIFLKRSDGDYLWMHTESNEEYQQVNGRVKTYFDCILESLSTADFPQMLFDELQKNLNQHTRFDGDLFAMPLNIGRQRLGVLLLGGGKTDENGLSLVKNKQTLKNIQTTLSLAIDRIFRKSNKVDSPEKVFKNLLFGLSNHNSYTCVHSNKTAVMAEKVARIMGCSSREIQILKWAANFHDIGKMFIPNDILNKPSQLNKAEWDIMRMHPEIGAIIIGLTTGLDVISDVIYTHHENFDGNGYPNGLKGGQIPLPSRILSVVDSYGAMTENRPYRNAISVGLAQQELMKCAGTQFDPDVVHKFLTILNTGALILGNSV